MNSSFLHKLFFFFFFFFLRLYSKDLDGCVVKYFSTAPIIIEQFQIDAWISHTDLHGRQVAPPRKLPHLKDCCNSPLFPFYLTFCLAKLSKNIYNIQCIPLFNNGIMVTLPLKISYNLQCCCYYEIQNDEILLDILIKTFRIYIYIA